TPGWSFSSARRKVAFLKRFERSQKVFPFPAQLLQFLRHSLIDSEHLVKSCRNLGRNGPVLRGNADLKVPFPRCIQDFYKIRRLVGELRCSITAHDSSVDKRSLSEF